MCGKVSPSLDAWHASSSTPTTSSPLPAPAPAASGKGNRAGGALGGVGVLRVRGDVRGQERRGLVGDAGGQGALCSRHAGRDRVRRGQLVPHAHRRGAVAAAHRGADDAPGGGARVVSFPKAASVALRDSQLRRNLTKATTHIRAKREAVVSELPDWQELREAGRALKGSSLIAP